MNLPRMAAGLVALLQVGALYQLTGDGPAAFVLAAAAVALPWFRLSLPRWTTVAAGLIAVLVFLARAIWVPPEIPNDWLLPGRWVASICQVLIVIQLFVVVETPFDRPFHSAYFGALLASCLVLFCQRETTSNSLYFFATSGTIAILFLLAAQPPPRSNRCSTRPQGLSFWFYLLAATGIVLGNGYFANTAKSATGILRLLVTRQVNDTLDPGISTVAYSSDGRLDAITRFQLGFPDSIALEGVCQLGPPGYLRGRVFTQFSGRRWLAGRARHLNRRLDQAGSGELEQLRRSLPGLTTNVDYGVFPIRPPLAGQSVEIELRHAPNHVGMVVFTPLETDIVAATASSLRLDAHNVVREGIRHGRSYYVFANRDRPEVEIPASLRQQLLQVPAWLRRELEPLSLELVADCNSDAERINAIRNWFRTNFEYSLDLDLDRRERLLDFIQSKRSGHCEYFATACALLLRLNGIPTRYATGFLMATPSTSDANLGEMWVSRNRDAHAWVEAYDRELRQWKIVEATPGIALANSLWGNFDGRFQLDQTTLAVADVDDETGWSGAFWARLQQFFRSLGERFSFVVNVALLGLVPGWLLFRLIRRRRIRHGIYGLAAEASTLKRLDRRLAKRGWVRRPSETLHQFAERIVSFDDEIEPWIREASQTYQSYADRRYRVFSK